MRICCTLYAADMAKQIIVQIIEELTRRGHEVYTFFQVPPQSLDSKLDLLKVFYCKEPLVMDRISIINMLTLKAVKEIIKQKIDVVFATGNCFGEGLVAGLATGKPVLCKNIGSK